MVAASRARSGAAGPNHGGPDEPCRLSLRSARSISRSTSDQTSGSVSLPALSAAWARVMITKATVHRTAIVLSLARKPASLLVEERRHVENGARMGEGG